MAAIERQRQSIITIQLPLPWAGKLMKGQIVRVYNSDFGMVVTRGGGSTGGDAVAVQMDGILTGIHMIRDSSGLPLIETIGVPPEVCLQSIIPNVLDVVAPTGYTSVAMPGRILAVERYGTSFTWSPRMGASAFAAIGVTQEQLQGLRDNIYTDIVGAAPSELNTLQEIAESLRNNPDFAAVVDGKQPKSPALSALSGLQVAPYGAGLLEHADAAHVLTYLGAQAAIPPGTYAVAADVDAAIAGLRAGVPQNLDNLAKLAASIGNMSDFAGSVTTRLATKQDITQGLTVLAGRNVTAYGAGLTELSNGSEVLQYIGGQAAIPVGTYATPADVTAAGQQIKSDILGGLAPDTLDTIYEIAQRIIGDESTVAALSNVVAGKQDGDATLTALSGKPTQAYGIGFLNLTDKAGALTYLGAQPSFPAGTYATPQDVATSSAAARAGAVSDVQAGVAANLNTLAKIAAAINGDPAFYQTVNTALAGKQPLAATLTTLSARNPSAFGMNSLDVTGAVAGSMVYSTDANGTAGLVTSTTVGRAALAANPGASKIFATGVTGAFTTALSYGSQGALALNTANGSDLKNVIGISMKFLATTTVLNVPVGAVDLLLPNFSIIGTQSGLASNGMVNAGTATKSITNSAQYFAVNRYTLRITVDAQCDLLIAMVAYSSNGAEAGGAGNIASGALGYGMAYGSKSFRRLTADRAGTYELPVATFGGIAGGYVNVLITNAGPAVNITQAVIMAESLTNANG